MRTLALHFEFSEAPPDDPDMSRFRRRLYRTLESALQATGSGRWRGGRYARGKVTIFLEMTDPTPSVMAQVRTVLRAHGLRADMTLR